MLINIVVGAKNFENNLENDADYDMIPSSNSRRFPAWNESLYRN